MKSLYVNNIRIISDSLQSMHLFISSSPRPYNDFLSLEQRSWSHPWFHPLLIPFLIKELHNYNWMITFSQTCTEQNTQHNNFNWFPQGTEACNPCCCTQGAGWMVRVGNVCVWPNFWCQSKLGRNISKNIATKSLSSWQILIDKTCVTTFTTLTKSCHSIPLPSTVRISLKH